LLENVIDPSATLAPGFRMSTVALTDGRVIQGVILSKTEATWEVQTPTDKLSIDVNDIDETADSTQSLMPEGLMDLLTPEEIRDLVAYLMSQSQVAPAEAESAR
jgi:putative heme-binding domain-containing protein